MSLSEDRPDRDFHIPAAIGDECGSQLLKKIDLHIHTVSTFSDNGFTYSLDAFKRYVEEAKLDAVAITNHDMFDGAQFRQIQKALKALVFPGVEVNVEKGHVLIIASPSELAEFESKAKKVAQRITKVGDTMSVAELQSIFGDLGRYLVIPHTDKGPPLEGEALEKLRPYISAGEVDSAKKFVRAIKDDKRFTPVLFSDARMRVDLGIVPLRQTYVDCGELNVSALKTCLRDKAKVALSEADGNELLQVLENGQKLSTGLNVILGARSSGKTHTLEEICKTQPRAKFIKQFSLVQQNDEADEREFIGNVERSRSTLADDYLSGFKSLLDEVMSVDRTANERKVQEYVETLLKAAREVDRRDAFSKCALFDEVEFAVGKTDTLQDLIRSVRQVIENEEFRPIIEKHVDLRALKRLAIELIGLVRATTLENKQKEFVNTAVQEIKKGLKVHTAVTQVMDVDLYRVSMDSKRIERFTEIVNFLKQQSVIFEQTIQGFRIEATKGAFKGAGQVRDASGVKTTFAIAFAKYGDPYDYLQDLLSDEGLTRSELYKLFTKISYRILNKDGYEISGGERSEFRLLKEIADAQNFDLLLVDEPESSFDNLFLKSDVCKLLKAISETMPVVVVTHNNTVGASVGADYLLFARKEIENGEAVYRIYSGHPTDKSLSTVDGKSISSHETMMDSLEAGVEAYENRRQGYEAIKN
jgi:hypothetical protein